MPTAANIPIQGLIYQQALASGVPPSIALAVAQKESSVSQWNPDGSLVTGTSGEIGVFQLMPATAAGLGVDPSDVSSNIQGGISYLAQLFQKYGDWGQALSAYNSGSPTGSPSYANSVLSIAASLGPTTTDASAADAADAAAIDAIDGTSLFSSPLVIAGIVVGGIALAWWALD